MALSIQFDISMKNSMMNRNIYLNIINIDKLSHIWLTWISGCTFNSVYTWNTVCFSSFLGWLTDFYFRWYRIRLVDSEKWTKLALLTYAASRSMQFTEYTYVFRTLTFHPFADECHYLLDYQRFPLTVMFNSCISKSNIQVLGDSSPSILLYVYKIWH